MNWINVEEKHFVDITIFSNGSYHWEENNNCPNKPFLVGLWVNNNKTETKKFEYYLVVLGENGLEEFTEDGTNSLCAWGLLDIEYWSPIDSPKAE